MRRNEVIHKVVQDPVTEGYESSYSNDASKVILSVDRPPQSCDEVCDQVSSTQKRAKCEEEIREKLVVQKAWRSDVGNES